MPQESRFSSFRKQYHDFILFFGRIIIVFTILFVSITVVRKNQSLDRIFKTSGFVRAVSAMTAYATKDVVELFGYEAKVEYTYAYTCVIDQGVYAITIPPSRGIWLGGHCLGLKLLSLFIILVACFPGRIKQKLLYILFGVIFIEMIYIARLVYLTIYSKHLFDAGISVYTENFVVGRAHNNLNTMIYFLVVILFIIYVRYFSQGKKKINQQIV